MALAWWDKTGVLLRPLTAPVQACFPAEQGTEQGLYWLVREYTDNRRAAEPKISFAIAPRCRGYAGYGSGAGLHSEAAMPARRNPFPFLRFNDGDHPPPPLKDNQPTWQRRPGPGSSPPHRTL